MSSVSPTNRVIILISHGCDEIATVYLFTRLRQAGLRVSLVGLDSTLILGHAGLSLRPEFSFWELMTTQACPLLILPGMPASIEHLFQEEDVRQWVRHVLDGNYVAATETAEPALTNITFPDLNLYYLPQGALSLAAFAELLINYAWEETHFNPPPLRTDSETMYL
jgi:hypothetical protein